MAKKRRRHRVKKIVARVKSLISGKTVSSELEFQVESIEFSDQTRHQLKPGDILVITGPNNGGKSTALRELREWIVTKHYRYGRPPNKVVTDVELAPLGSLPELISYLDQEGRPYTRSEYGDVQIVVPEQRHTSNSVEIDKEHWDKGDICGPHLGIFVTFLDTRQRLELCETRERVKRGHFGYWPLQILDNNIELERRVGRLFDYAFGSAAEPKQLVADRDGNEIRFRFGDPKTFPLPDEFHTRLGNDKIVKLPLLEEQGDGMKSFAGILSAIVVEHRPLILIDEPEAFLHPPQVRKIAEVLATEAPARSQIIIATHDYEFIRGLLDSKLDRITLARIRRDGSRNPTTILSHQLVQEIWSDPLLRTSHVLSALFHDVAVLCEGDSDVRFFQTILSHMKKINAVALPDIQFFSCGSKAKLHKVAAALRALGVPTLVVADCDVLNDLSEVQRIVASLGGSIVSSVAAYKKFAAAVNAARKMRSAAACKGELESIVKQLSDLPTTKQKQPLSKQIRASINEVIGEPSQWKFVKREGRSAVLRDIPEVVESFDAVMAATKSQGLLINPYGELESLWPEGLKFPKGEWLSHVMERPNLGQDPEFEVARKFINEIVTASLAKTGRAIRAA